MEKRIFNCYADYENGFIGFYNGYDSLLKYDSLLSSQIADEIEDYHSGDNVDLGWDDFKCDMDGFKKEVCEKWCEGLRELLGNGCKVKYKDCWSPACYNYCGDEIRFELELSEEKTNEIIKFLKENEKVAEYIEKRWSDHSGFMSFLSSDAKEWGSLIETYIETGEDKSRNENIETYIGFAVYYWLEYGKGKDVKNYLWETICEIETGMFVELNENGRMKIKK